MIRGGSHASSSSAAPQQALRGQHAIAHVHERVRVDLPQVVEVLRQVLRTLRHRLDRRDAHTAPAALHPEVPEVLLTVRRDLAQDGNPPMAVLDQPRHHQCRVTPDVAVAEPEAIVALQSLRSGPRDQRHLQLVRQRRDRDRVVGAVRPRDTDATLVDQVLETVGRVLRRSVRQAVFGVEHELVRTVQQAGLDRLVERQAVNLVVPAARPVEARRPTSRS